MTLRNLENKIYLILLEAIKPFDIKKFTSNVMNIAKTLKIGKFGDNKVFIWYVYKEYNKRNPISFSQFGNFLTKANNIGLLKLARADLVGAMNMEDVENSRVPYMNTEFHFIRI